MLKAGVETIYNGWVVYIGQCGQKWGVGSKKSPDVFMYMVGITVALQFTVLRTKSRVLG